MNSNKLAIHGGNPVRKQYLPYGRQWIGEDDIKAVASILRSDFLTTGPILKDFEEKVANYVGTTYAVAFSSGTAALHAACFTAGITHSSEVITSSITFAASANCVLYMGATPIFADIDPQTYNIDPACIEKLVNRKTKAIIPVHFTGMPTDLDAIKRIAAKNELVIIEDAAHALGSLYKGKLIGSNGDMTMFSFHPIKHITTGEGGIITTNNKEYYEKLMQFRSHGITRVPENLLEDQGPWYYEMQFLGYNYRLTDIQAALGLNQLKKLNYFLRRRRDYAKMYNAGLRGLKEIRLPASKEGYESSWHLYVIRLNLDLLSVGRREIFEALQKENIGVNVHYQPVYLMPYYQELGYRKGLCPEAEEFYKEAITLPLFPSMTPKDVSDVIRGVKKVISYYKKIDLSGADGTDDTNYTPG